MNQSTNSAPSVEATSPRQTLRVCHLAYTFYESDNRVMRYAETLAAQGAAVEVIALRRSGQAVRGSLRGVQVLRIQPRAKNERRQATYLAKIVWFLVQSMFVLAVRHLRKPYDIIHVHNVPDFLVFAALVPKLTGARVILDIHDILPELYAGKFGATQDSVIFKSLLMVERLSCRFADHVIVANHLWHERLVQRAVSPGKCTTILNYPDLKLFKPLPHGSKRSDGKFVFLYPGTLNRYQGLDVAIRAFALVKDRMPNAELHIYGEGPARPDLAVLVEDLVLNGRVRLMDPLPIDKISVVMASADAGVEPKQAEGFSNEALSTKILEFMACGVPVMVSRTRIHAHYFDEALVRFFRPGQEQDLADAMVEVYDRGAAPGQLQTAQEFAKRYSWQERVGDYRRIVELLTPVPRRQPATAP